MPSLVCGILIVAMGMLNSSFAAIREGKATAGYRVGVKQKKSAKAKRPTPAAIWQGIKAAAQDEVRSNSSLVTVPKFIVEQIGSSRQLTIERGDVVGELGLKDDPYELPFKKQMLIEALRSSLAKTDLGGGKKRGKKGSSPQVSGSSSATSIGRPYLLSAEKLVKKTVVDIESERDKNRLAEKLRASEKQIDDLLYDQIYMAVEQVAQRNGYNIIYGRGAAVITKFSVAITTMPDGAKVFVMTDLAYRKQLIMRTNRTQWPWIEIVQNPYQLLGRYRYLTVWPDGKRAEGNINVASRSPLRFLPN